MDYISERIRCLRRLDAYDRLLTVHDYHYCSQYPELVDFISIQIWKSGLYHHMIEVKSQHADKPVFNIEHGGYEASPYLVFAGDYSDPVVCLERNYVCVFAGTYSTYYWQATSWYVVIADPMGLPAHQRPRFDYYRHLVDLFARYPFAELKPTEQYASSTMCLSNDEDAFLFLVPRSNDAFHVILPQHVQTSMAMTWFNPLTGEYVDAGTVELRHWHPFQSPWSSQIAVLILESAET